MYSDELQASLLPQINNEEVQLYFLQGGRRAKFLFGINSLGLRKQTKLSLWLVYDWSARHFLRRIGYVHPSYNFITEQIKLIYQWMPSFCSHQNEVIQVIKVLQELLFTSANPKSINTWLFFNMHLHHFHRSFLFNTPHNYMSYIYIYISWTVIISFTKVKSYEWDLQFTISYYTVNAPFPWT